MLRSFLRDRFQQNMIGILLATFTYSLLVLREVRGPLESVEDGGTPYIPRLSVFLAVIFAVAAVLALLASISHTSQSLRSSAVARQLISELVALVRKTFPEPESEPGGGSDARFGPSATDVMTPSTTDPKPGDRPAFDTRREEPGAVVTSSRRGWVQQISIEAIRDALTEGDAVRLDTSVGAYVYDGAPLLTVWPPPSADDVESQMHRLRGAFAIGDERSLQQDIAFGFTMIEDIAGKALSPGVNDPNTAAEVIEQLGEAVLTVLEREMHPVEMVIDGCLLSRGTVASYDDMVVAAFNQIRHFSTDQPTVQLVLIRTLARTGDELTRRGRDRVEALDALRSMMRLVERELAPEHTDPAADAARDVLATTTWY